MKKREQRSRFSIVFLSLFASGFGAWHNAFVASEECVGSNDFKPVFVAEREGRKRGIVLEAVLSDDLQCGANLDGGKILAAFECACIELLQGRVATQIDAFESASGKRVGADVLQSRCF